MQRHSFFSANQLSKGTKHQNMTNVAKEVFLNSFWCQSFLSKKSPRICETVREVGKSSFSHLPWGLGLLGTWCAICKLFGEGNTQVFMQYHFRFTKAITHTQNLSTLKLKSYLFLVWFEIGVIPFSHSDGPHCSSWSTKRTMSGRWKAWKNHLDFEFLLKPVPVNPPKASYRYSMSTRLILSTNRVSAITVQDLEITGAGADWCLLLDLKKVLFARILIFGHGYCPPSSGLISAEMVIWQGIRVLIDLAVPFFF